VKPSRGWRRRAGVGRIPNHFAYAALFGWPFVCLILFIALPLELAAISSLLGGFLLLPSNFQVDLPLLPPLDKTSVAAVSTLLLCWMKGSTQRPPRQSWVITLLSVVYIVTPLFTSLGNSYELQYAGVSIPGFYPVDAIKTAGRNAIFLAPFFIGSHYLWSERSRKLLLTALPISALFYSLPMLVEIRLSPQFHRWVYGYHPSDFLQQIRGGGFRPVVFLNHGLMVALFVCLAMIAALVATRAKWRIMRVPAGAVSAYLFGLLLLCKSLGSAVYGIVLAPLILFTRPKTWTRIACALLLFVCAYPALRWHNLIPVHHIADAATSVSKDRAESFQTRVKNEDQLLAKAEQKPVFGWGEWGRQRIYDAYTGKDISVTDGEWIIQFGTFGWAGYLSLFGLFAAAAFRAMRSLGNERTSASFAVGGLSLLLVVNVMDLLPNASLMPITFLMAGSISRSVRLGAKKSAMPQPTNQTPRSAAPAPVLASS